MAVSDPLVVKESFLSAEARADAAKTIPVRATTGARHDGPTPRQRWRKRGLVALAVVLGPYIAYVVLLNLAFATGLFTWLVNKGTPDFRMEIGTAWTLVPGRVHVKDCTLRVEDSNLQVFFVLPESVVDVDVLAFFDRTVHFERAKARDVRFWFRQKVESTADPKLAERVALYPRIPGFEAIPFKAPGPKPPKTPEDIAKLWSIQLDDTEGTLSDLWVEEYRFKGSGYIRGAFRLDPLRKLDLRATRLELRDGVVTVGEHVAAKDVLASIRLAIPNLDVSALEAPTLLRTLDAKIDLGATLVAAPIRLYSDEALSLGDQGGRIAMTIGLQKGVLESGSRLSLDLDCSARKAPVTLRGGVIVEARVGEVGRVDVIARVPSATALVGDDAGKTAFAARNVEAFATLALPSVDSPSFEGGTVTVGSLDAPDLRFLTPLLGPGVARAGRFHASFHGKVDSSFVARGSVMATATGVDLAFEGARVKASVKVAGAYTSAPKLEGGRITDAKIEAPTVSLEIPRAPERAASITGVAQEVSWVGLVPKSFSARALVNGSDSRILTVPVMRDEGVEAMAARSLVGSGPFRAGGSVHVAGGVVRARIGQAVAGKVLVTGGLVQKPTGLDAAFLVRALGLNVGLGITKGEVSVKPLKSPEWLDGELKRLGLLSAAEGSSQKVAPEK